MPAPSFLNPGTWCGGTDEEDLTLLNNEPKSTSATSEEIEEIASKLDIDEVLYAINAFWATLKPVAISLVLSSLAVVFIQSETTRSDNQSGLKVYEINDDDSDDGGGDSNSVKLGKSLVNAIIIVCVLGMFTFVLVFCYWMRCMKFLLGYMIFSSGVLLAFMGGLMWYTALEVWELPCDAYTFFFVLYNFAIVGVISIFYQKGIPMIVTQSYLVCTSVILAWQLARFDEWTGWSLLVMLALYDLCAVLTPCGPLKVLVGLMQERNEPLPGLLYEAELPQPERAPGKMSVEEFRRVKSGSPGNSVDGKEAMQIDSTTNSVRMARLMIPSPPALGLGVSMLGFMTQDGSDARPSKDRGRYVNPPEEGSQHSEDTRKRTHSGASDETDDSDYSIKLGLGDFVFYSVLVSRAATYGFAPFAACALVILGGLGITLVLLSVYRKALPALPISIMLGVLFYFCTRFIITPFLEASAAVPIYM